MKGLNIMFLNKEERAETIWACRFCPMCHVADRVAQLVKRESYTPRGRGAIIFALDQGLLDWDQEVADIMYTTLNDGLLREWCVGNYDHEELVLDARAKLYEKGLAPEEVGNFIRNLHAGQGKGPSPAEMLRETGVFVTSGAEILLFAGCTVRESQGETLVNMGRLFNRAGVDFQCLPHEPCCGWPLYQLGDLAGAREFSVQVAGAIRSSGASTVVTLDADCYRMLLTRTVRLGGDLQGIKVVHVSSLLAEWVQEGKIQFVRRLAEPAAYHDPCALARYCGDPDAPRKVLGAVLDLELTEINPHGSLANCCGAGGMLGIYRPDLTREAARLRLAEAWETGARVLVTACPRCDQTFLQALDSHEQKELRLINLVDLVAWAAGLSSRD